MLIIILLRPRFSDTWLRDNSKANVDRTIAVTSATADQIICDIAFHCKATRPMPVYSIPEWSIISKVLYLGLLKCSPKRRKKYVILKRTTKSCAN